MIPPLWKRDVNRWHSHPSRKLRNSGDTVHAHAARCCILLLDLHPTASAQLIASCLMHDAAEGWTGDVPYNAKHRWPMLTSALAWAETDVEMQVGVTTPATQKDRDWIKLVDRLDAYLWMLDVAPEEAASFEWQECQRDLLARADALGVRQKVWAMIE